MSKLHFTTKHANAASVQRKWYVVDGTNQTVGRMCSKIAHVLRGWDDADPDGADHYLQVEDMVVRNVPTDTRVPF